MDAGGNITGLLSTLLDITEKKRIEEELSDSEEKFHVAFEKAGLAIMIIKNNKPIASNPALLHMFGYTEKELGQITIEQITHPDDIEQELLLIKDMNAGNIDGFQIEKRYIHKNGNIIFGDLNVSQKKGDKFGVSIIQDITKRKQSEKELRISHQEKKRLA